MPTDHRALAQRLAAYLAERDRRKGVALGLTPGFLEAALDRGVGSAFGVEWDARGNLTCDHEEPEPGFLAAWVARQQPKR